MERRTLLAVHLPFAAGQTDKPKVVGPRANYFPNVVLQTHENQSVKFYDDLVQGKIVVINFMYAECKGICTPVTANLVKVQKALGERVGKDIFLYSITLDPEHDTPKVLKHYAGMHSIKSGWTLLTGKRADIETLRRKLGFVDSDPKVDRDRSRHIGMLRFGNEALDRWAMCPSLSAPDQIVKSILWMENPKPVPSQS